MREVTQSSIDLSIVSPSNHTFGELPKSCFLILIFKKYEI